MHKTHHSIMSLFFFTSLAVFISWTSAVAVDTNPPLLLSSASAADHNSAHNDKPALPLLTLPFLPPNTSNSSNLTPPSPPSSLPTTTTTTNNTNNLSYVCKGKAFGYDLSPPSCNDAIRQIPISTSSLSFGMRDAVIPGQKTFDIRLPQRFISSDGKCAVEPILTSEAEQARASWYVIFGVHIISFFLNELCIES